MKTYIATIFIRAECEADAIELINEYTGQETDIEIKEVREPTEEDTKGLKEQLVGLRNKEEDLFNDMNDTKIEVDKLEKFLEQ